MGKSKRKFMQISTSNYLSGKKKHKDFSTLAAGSLNK
jgi:hypothetical protein